MKEKEENSVINIGAIPRRLIVLDIDENLVSIKLDSSSRCFLSKSAREDLSKSDDGKIYNPVLLVNEKGSANAYEVTAFRRKAWKTF